MKISVHHTVDIRLKNKQCEQTTQKLSKSYINGYLSDTFDEYFIVSGYLFIYLKKSATDMLCQ